ncbi:uncharacterized protein Z519_10990 [Cladophialophora bantiana CBS 173.52]|uniref:Uncharacterized protein n=1 Tax=Cladophialophora bantiana (strain ATCC 10958 / CBS 173.52 / CDC B-1940 / NIH 8579) TaxID=1442370 RepID=A0A0D2EE74_CLAB1|nr:uncharacterized protein Z519_10990 [Cladophialophora bantiana CBS 173.52]KIW88421.1 hypothetical protein Z519_10990 [Cladophialophora bantiana CBS 173.52]
MTSPSPFFFANQAAQMHQMPQRTIHNQLCDYKAPEPPLGRPEMRRRLGIDLDRAEDVRQNDHPEQEKEQSYHLHHAARQATDLLGEPTVADAQPQEPDFEDDDQEQVEE